MLVDRYIVHLRNDLSASSRPTVNGGAYIPIPPSSPPSAAEAASQSRPTFDAIPYRGSIANMGAGPCLGPLKAIRTELGRGARDQVAVAVERDTAPRTIDVPDDLADALGRPGVRAAFDRLSCTNRCEHVTAVINAKNPETRTLRIVKIVDSLAGGA
ncbi:YdeI/OmpD-associated family protein [Nocardia niigatensis]|uniref:YdeI/OmpD-associated family protein n=1 Tax=Nocardia niigatensis TaxID=209249 RepID=UPI001FE1F8E6|nr:YdeI/OmpD-associated family protein [Nocardia niigatensis]